MSKDFLDESSDFEKKYVVYIEQAKASFDGYKYSKPEYASSLTDKKNFLMTFYFRKDNKKLNPLFIIDKLDGDTFSERIDIINHFKKHHALSYAIDLDGLADAIKEDNK